MSACNSKRNRDEICNKYATNDMQEFIDSGLVVRHIHISFIEKSKEDGSTSIHYMLHL